MWQVYREQGGLVLGMGDEAIDKLVAWRTSTGATFPLLLMQDTYDAYAEFSGTVYALDIVVDQQVQIYSGEHGAVSTDVAAQFAQLLE